MMNTNKQINKIEKPPITSKHSVSKKPLCFPIYRVGNIKRLLAQEQNQQPRYASALQVGLLSQLEDSADQHVNLNHHLIDHPLTTFILTVSGDSMVDAGIFNDDLLIVDRSLIAASGKVVIAAVNGELTVKRLHKTPQGVFLVAENCAHSAIELKEPSQVQILGVVIYTIHAIETKCSR
jgi:DNA polymerase V